MPFLKSISILISLMACSLMLFFGNSSLAGESTSPSNPPQENSLTFDVGTSISEIFEYDKTSRACNQYWSLLDANDQPLPGASTEQVRTLEIYCGKWLFLNWETTGKLPLPELLLQAMQRSWPDRIGKNFEKLGFLPNPFDKKRPLGIVPSTTKYTGLPSVNVACSACHVGQLADGRYAIGAPNNKLDMSNFNLMSYYPIFATMSGNERLKLNSQVYNYYIELERTEKRRVLDGNGGIDWSNVIFKYSALLRWLHIGSKGLPDAKFVVMPPERDLLSWINGRPGVFNPGAPMLTIQREGVPNISIPQIWGVTGYERDFLNGQAAPVGQTTKYASLEKFAADAFIYAYQDASLVQNRNIKPLVSYLRQIKAPKTSEQLDGQAIASGKKIFMEHCVSCHDGAYGESTKLYPASEVQSIAGLEDPRVGYKATTPIAKLVATLSDTLGARLNPAPVGIKSRRLSGIWSRQNLMTHGSIKSLNELLCLEHDREKDALTHHDICANHSLADRQALGQFLKTL